MERRNGIATVLTLLGCLAAIAIAVALFQLSSATDRQACIEKAEAKFPALPVTAFLTRDRASVGPLKVSFVKERTAAADKCD